MKRIYLNTHVIAVILLFAGFLTGCKSPKQSKPIPEIAGNWTIISTPPATALLPTATGFIGLSPSSGGLSPNRTTDTAWYSADHGNTWSVILNPTPATQYTIQVDLVNNNNTVAYSASDSTFYVSNNGGQSWAVLNHLSRSLSPGLPYSIDSNQLIVDSSYILNTFLGVSGSRLFVLRTPYYNFTGGNNAGRLLKSDNNGNTWDTVYNITYQSGLPLEMYGIGNTLSVFAYGQVLRSNDNGSSWSVINSASPITFPGGMLSNGALVGLDANNFSIYQSYDSAQIWAPFYEGESGVAGPVLAFDSVIMIPAYYMNAWHILCSHPESANWYGADGGIQANSTYTNLYVDNTYVYAYQTGGQFFRRPRTDFSGI